MDSRAGTQLGSMGEGRRAGRVGGSSGAGGRKEKRKGPESEVSKRSTIKSQTDIERERQRDMERKEIEMQVLWGKGGRDAAPQGRRDAQTHPAGAGLTSRALKRVDPKS